MTSAAAGCCWPWGCAPGSSSGPAPGRARSSTWPWSTGWPCCARRWPRPTPRGCFSDERGTNLLDSGAPFYDCYRCADGQWISVGALEPQFYDDLLTGLGLAGPEAWPDGSRPDRDDQGAWPALRARFTEVFATRHRADWLATFAALDACVAPVHTFASAAGDPHLVARGTWVERDGVTQPAPAPRFGRTPATLDRPPAPAGHHTDEVLAEAGLSTEEIAGLRSTGAVA